MSAEYPEDLLYTKEHEWARLKGNVAVIGVSRFAVEQLGDVTQIELPREGEVVKKDDVFGTIESVKAVSDLFAPFSGKVVKVNTTLHESPEAVNEEPYDDGWLIEIELSNTAEAKELMSSTAYRQFLADEEE